MKAPKTLQEAIKYFADPEQAFVYAVNWRWPDGVVTCPRCGGDQHSFIKTRLLWFCKGCKKQFTVKVGTIFEDSPITLDKWMVAMWMLVNCKNGVSSYELARTIGITQKSAWFMLQRLRLALQDDTGRKIGGTVEADETFIGGKARNMHRDKRTERITGRGATGKTIVMGVLQRGGKVHAQVVANRDANTLQGVINERVRKGANICTDELTSYWGLDEDFVHNVINHAEEYVNGKIHTNGMENFWSLLKRGLNGTYVSVEPFHLFRYIDEQAFRYNHRKDGKRIVTDAERFHLALSQVAGKRLTVAEVTGKSGSQAEA